MIDVINISTLCGYNAYIHYSTMYIISTNYQGVIMKTTINLHFKTVTNPDFEAFMFYVESGKLFDADDYSDAYNLNRNDIDAQDVHSCQDAAGKLNDGEWLLVEHSIDE